MKRNFWKAAIWAGVIAAMVMLIFEMILNPLVLNNSMWGPVRMMGAILLGSGVLPPPATFDFGVTMAALAVHLPLSIIFAVIIGYLVRNSTTGAGIVIGAVIGLVLYFINFYGFTALFPWFENARNWVQIVIHILFGVAAVWAFNAIYRIKPAVENK